MPRTVSCAQRLARADGVRAHEVALQRARVRGVDAHAREAAEAGREPVHGLARGHEPLDRGAPALDARALLARRARGGAPPRATVSSSARVDTAIDATGRADQHGPLLVSSSMTSGPRPVRAPRGLELSCRGWQQEAALRMLMNNLDPDVAEDPDRLVVYGGTGRAARSWEAFDAIVATLRRLEDDETLLVQSGKPVGVFRTHDLAPRVLIANSHLVPEWADWDTFRRLEAEGLTMYGQMTAGSWIYIGTQGIVQGTYETFAAVARAHFGGSLRGRLVLTAGLRRHGRRAAARRRDERRRLPDRRRRRAPPRPSRRDALPRPRGARPRHRAARDRGGEGPGRRPLGRPRRRRRRGLRAAARARRRARRRDRPDLRARSARRLRPLGLHARAGAPSCASPIPSATSASRATSMARQCAAMVRVPGARRRSSSTTATACARRRARPATREAFAYPGFVEAYVRPLFCQGIGPFRWAALSGDPARHRRDRPRDRRAVPRERGPAALDAHGEGAHRLPGPAGAHLLARLRRAPPRGPADQRARALGRGHARRS